MAGRGGGGAKVVRLPASQRPHSQRPDHGGSQTGTAIQQGWSVADEPLGHDADRFRIRPARDRRVDEDQTCGLCGGGHVGSARLTRILAVRAIADYTVNASLGEWAQIANSDLGGHANGRREEIHNELPNLFRRARDAGRFRRKRDLNATLSRRYQYQSVILVALAASHGLNVEQVRGT